MQENLTQLEKDVEQAQRVEANIAESNQSEYCPCGERATEIGYHGISDRKVQSYWFCSASCFLKHKEQPDSLGATA